MSTKIMGILNVTPDSFSDGGEHFAMDEAVQFGLQMACDGADVIDVGGESTRPGFTAVGIEDEINRVVPVIRQLRERLPENIQISVDTTKYDVAMACVEAGVDIINDVSGDLSSPLIELAAQKGLEYIFVHNEQTDKFEDVLMFFRHAIEEAEKAGLPKSKIMLDPGIGFGKEQDLNEEIVRRVRELTALGVPVLMAASRKRLVGNILNTPVNDRFEGDAAVTTLAIAGGCAMVRVHDVARIKRVVAVTDKIMSE